MLRYVKSDEVKRSSQKEIAVVKRKIATDTWNIFFFKFT
jgi:hypothetical protein